MPSSKIAVFCSGYGSNFQAILDAVASKKLRTEVALMVCDNPKAFAIRRAKKANVPLVLIPPKLFATRQAHEKVIVSILKQQRIDLIVLAGYMRILTPYFVRSYRNRILNIHPSLLPKFKGAHAIRDAYEAGEKTTGVTVHFVTEKLDAGPIVCQKKILVPKGIRLPVLEKKIHAVEHALYPKAIATVLRSR